VTAITASYEVIGANGALLCQTDIFAIAEPVHDSAPGSVLFITRDLHPCMASPASPA
jgi:hypothetical protein